MREQDQRGGVGGGGVGVYSYPELYDLAFSYRDFESEVEFLKVSD
jgi:hypothetical protein